MFAIARFPSWHAYSMTGSPAFSVSGIANVQGRSHVSGSIAGAAPSTLSGAARPQRAAAKRDDARLVHHLVADGHVARRLHDLVGVAVDRRHHRAGQPARDAPVVQAAILPRVGPP